MLTKPPHRINSKKILSKPTVELIFYTVRLKVKSFGYFQYQLMIITSGFPLLRHLIFHFKELILFMWPMSCLYTLEHCDKELMTRLMNYWKVFLVFRGNMEMTSCPQKKKLMQKLCTTNTTSSKSFLRGICMLER